MYIFKVHIGTPLPPLSLKEMTLTTYNIFRSWNVM